MGHTVHSTVPSILTGVGLRVRYAESKGSEEDEEDKVDEEIAEVDVTAICPPLVLQQASDQGVLQQVNLG